MLKKKKICNLADSCIVSLSTEFILFPCIPDFHYFYFIFFTEEDVDQLSSSLFPRVLGNNIHASNPQSCTIAQPYHGDVCTYAPTYDNYLYQMKSRTTPYTRPPLTSFTGYSSTQAYSPLYSSTRPKQNSHEFSPRWSWKLLVSSIKKQWCK